MNTGGLRVISKATSDRVSNLPQIDTVARNEIDTLAETSCAGTNWIPLFFTGETVTVYGFKGDEKDSSIPVATCATKVITQSGIPYILICPAMLYYGASLSQSLINPHQLRQSGTLIHDNPTTAREDEFGLFIDNLFVPFNTT